MTEGENVKKIISLIWKRPLVRLLLWIDRRVLRHRFVELCLWIGQQQSDCGPCEFDGCQNVGVGCYYPDAAYGHGPDTYVCYDHIRGSGFCSGCGLFWGGCESFDFDPNNLCDNCRYDPELTGDWSEYDDDPFEEEVYS